MKGSKKDILEGKTVGQLLAEGFEELAAVAKTGKHNIPKKFTCHKITLDLEPTAYSPKMVKETRQIMNASQAVFAQFLGVSAKTVRAWEQGVNIPKDSACRMMDEIRHNPKYFQKRLKESMVVS